MKKLVALLSLSLLFALPSFAQHKQERFKDMDPQERVDKMMLKMTEKLDLTAEQQKQIKPLLLAQQEKKMTERKRKQVEHQQMAEKLKAILSPEQFESFQKHHKKRERMQRRKMEQSEINQIED